MFNDPKYDWQFVRLSKYPFRDHSLTVYTYSIG